MYASILKLKYLVFGYVINIKDQVFIDAFGKHLRKLRKVKKMSQESLAYSADIPLSQIGRIERGHINTSISTVYALAKALEIHPRELLDFSIGKKK